jgi:hypothetical protein
MTQSDKLLTIKELASELGRSRRYVTHMRRRGFLMPGGKATVAEARSWLVRNPPPCTRKELLASV